MGREQAFADEAVRQLDLLTLSPRGFAGPQVDQQGAGPGSAVFVSYRKGPLTIGIRLLRGHGGGLVRIWPYRGAVFSHGRHELAAAAERVVGIVRQVPRSSGLDRLVWW